MEHLSEVPPRHGQMLAGGGAARLLAPHARSEPRNAESICSHCPPRQHTQGKWNPEEKTPFPKQQLLPKVSAPAHRRRGALQALLCRASTAGRSIGIN